MGLEVLDEYMKLQKQLFEYFGYVENWVAIPVDDQCKSYWYLTGEGSGDCVRYANTEKDLKDEDAGEYYENEIYTQRFLPKWVYRGKDYTMVCVDTHTDGNKFLQIFANANESPA